MKRVDWHNSGNYKEYILWKSMFLLTLCILAFLMCAVAISVGSSNLPLSTVLRTMFGQGAAKERVIVLSLRLPRALTAIVAGFGLGIVGCVMQSVLRNPLVSASTVGVSQGASFGASFAIIVLGAGAESLTSESIVNISDPYLVSVCAFSGAMISTLIILIIARWKRQAPATLILTGVALGALFSGVATLIEYFADDVKVAAVVHWSFGNIGGTSMREIGIMAAVTAAAFVYFYLNRWNYNAFRAGEENARGLGVNTEALMTTSMVVCALTTSVIISYIGLVSFIGLIAPHLVRKAVGSDYRFLVPAAGLMGAIVLILSDILSRIIVPPIILPIGAITSFVGAITFLWIILKEKKQR